MRCLIATIILLAGLSPVHAQIKQQQEDLSSVPDGSYVTYYPNGQVRFEGYVLNHKWEGDNKFFYKNGQLESKGCYKNGKPEGSWESYYGNGQPEKKSTYRYGLWEGRYLWYTQSGRITETIYSKGEIIRGDVVLSEGN